MEIKVDNKSNVLPKKTIFKIDINASSRKKGAKIPL